MRFRLPLGRTLFFVCALIAAVIVLLPMRLGLDWIDLDDRGLTAREAQGSLWNGTLAEAQFGETAIGDVDAGLGFLPLLVGRARLSVDRESGDGGDRLDGAFTVSGAEFGIDDLHARLAGLGLFDPLPVAALETEDVTVHFESDLCVEAEGLVRAEVAGDVGGFALPGSFTGNARCDEGAVLLPLVSESGMEQLNIRIGAAGEYGIELLVSASDDAMRERLAAAGFVPGPRGYAITVQGVF